jgi:membrane protein DedA with SNARE-associated domain
MVDLPEHLSYAGIAIALVLTGIGLPIPEEAFVIFAGIASNNGVLNPWLALAACILGAQLGDLLTYSIGRHFGRNIVRDHPWFARYLTPEREIQIEAMIRRHGLKAFFLARFMIGVRSAIYLVAGILRVPVKRFVIANFCCAFCVISFFFGLSFFFADRIKIWWEYLRQAELALTVSIGVAAAVACAYLYVRQRRKQAWAALRQQARESRPARRGDQSMDEPVNVEH